MSCTLGCSQGWGGSSGRVGGDEAIVPSPGLGSLYAPHGKREGTRAGAVSLSPPPGLRPDHTHDRGGEPPPWRHRGKDAQRHHVPARGRGRERPPVANPAVAATAGMNVTGPAGNRSCGSGEEPIPLPTFSTAAKVRVAVTCLLFLSSACCNGAVLWSTARAPPRHRRPPRVRVLMANLAAADLLVTVVVMPLDAAWNVTVQWYGGDAACRALMFLKLAAMYASAFVTVVIALDRHAAIVNPLAVGCAERRNKAMLCAAWALSAVLALPQVGEPQPRGAPGDTSEGMSPRRVG